MAETVVSGLKRDLGDFGAPLLVFGGPLSNLGALEALLAEAGRRAIPDTHLICTGDVVGYAAEPEACVALLRERAIATVMGNVEEALGVDAEDCGCNFVEGSTCDALANDWYGHARAHVSAASRAWMRALPRILTLRLAGHPVTVVHGGLRRINRFVFASDEATLAEEAEALKAPGIVVAGHAGLPFSRAAGDVLWHNPGALGLPANDGTPRVWCALIAPGDDGVRFTHLPLAYDHAGTARKMRAARLPEPYARAMETGLWPDTAILPEAEARATGRALAPAPAVWPNPAFS